MRRSRAPLALLAAVACAAPGALAQITAPVERAIDFDRPRTPGTVRGVVFHDANFSGVQDAGEPGIPDVLVSNGREVTRTDELGRYRLPIDEDGGVVFVCKPSGWRTPSDEHRVPRFAYVHKPEGSPPLEYPGVAPTGRLPDRVDFLLVPHEEPAAFNVSLFGDPQPRDLREIDYMAERVVSELVGLEVEAVIALGDIMFDDLSLYPAYNQVMSAIGAPVYNVHGNHDLNFDATDDATSDETWERVYGATNYAFQIADTHFIALDNVVYEGGQNDRRYHGLFNDDAMAFLASYLRETPEDDLVVVCFHIPLWDVRNRAEFLTLLGSHRRTLTLSAHWHTQRHIPYGAEEGWPTDARAAKGWTDPDDAAHWHLCHATACGSWWRGAPGPDGIPHATMRDGGPVGTSVLRIDPAARYGYTIDFRPSGRAPTEQMGLWTTPDLSQSLINRGEAEVVANVWAAAPGDRVEMRLLRTHPTRRPSVTGWTAMTPEPERPDPAYAAAHAREQALREQLGEEGRLPWRGMRPPRETHHLWSAPLPPGLDAGPYVVRVRWTDRWGREHESVRVIRVNEG